METSPKSKDAIILRMKRRIMATAGERHGPVFYRLLEDLVDALGEQLAEIREENRVVEKKMDGHVSTLRSDISHIRQGVRTLVDRQNSSSGGQGGMNVT